VFLFVKRPTSDFNKYSLVPQNGIKVYDLPLLSSSAGDDRSFSREINSVLCSCEAARCGEAESTLSEPCISNRQCTELKNLSHFDEAEMSVETVVNSKSLKTD
jgi:hypothetical protein